MEHLFDTLHNLACPAICIVSCCLFDTLCMLCDSCIDAFCFKDMNEVANFIRGQYLPDGKEGCYDNKWNYPPYCPSMYLFI